MLCLSYALGKISSYEHCVQRGKSTENWEQKLFNNYTEHFHLLFINKKIQSEEDYAIFNTKLL